MLGRVPFGAGRANLRGGRLDLHVLATPVHFLPVLHVRDPSSVHLILSSG